MVGREKRLMAEGGMCSVVRAPSPESFPAAIAAKYHGGGCTCATGYGCHGDNRGGVGGGGAGV